MRAGFVRGCVVGAVGAACAAAIRSWLSPWLGATAPLLIFPGVVAVAAWVGGLWAGLFTTGLSGALGLVLFVRPMTVIAGRDVHEGVLLTLFVAQGALITTLTASLQRNRRQLAAALAVETRDRMQMMSAARLKEEFLGIVSHELRTPLNVVLGSVWRLRHSADANVHRIAATIERNARAQAVIIDNLIYVSEALAGQRALTREPIAVHDLVADVRRDLEHEIAANKIELHVQPSEEAPTIRGDAGLLRQALTAVISNAIKFSSEGARVELAVAVAPSQVEIVVTDHGSGMSPPVLARAFEPFWQADSTVTRSHGGLGLGLTAARRIAVLHGGVLLAHSEGDGQGATFRLALPRDADVAASKQSSTERQAMAVG